MERKLAAILAADVVGFSRLMGADEAATMAAFNDVRHQVFEPLVRDHQGNVVKRTGDGWLVEFPSALDAVKCAISIQEKLVDHQTLKLRIGVHIGDVVHDDEGDIHGDGVNIASRLEGVSAAGGVAISDQVLNALDGTHAAAFGDGGTPNLKNITRPIRVWTWPCRPGAPRPAVDVSANEPPVILLEPLSLGGDMEAAADLSLDIQSGLQDALALRSGIKVTTSADGDTAPTYRLHGRCRVSGDRCRLHLYITMVRTGEICWTTKIDGEIEDVFAFVDSVVWRVSAAIRVHVNAYSGAIYAERRNEDLSLQQLLSKAAYFMQRFDPRDMTLARETTAEAVARAPEDPMALAMHSFALMQSVPLAIDKPEDIDVDGILAIADKAVQFGPTVDYAFHNRARIRLWLRGDLEGCAEDAKRALAINAGLHFAKEDLALVDIFGENTERGVNSLEEIVTQLPEQPTTAYRLSILAIGHAILGDMASAIVRARDAYERKPTIRLHALAYAVAASDDPAITGAPAFQSMVKDHVLRIRDAACFPFAKTRDTEKLASMLQRAGVPE